MDFIAGCVGGAAACIASHPLDTIKVRMQCQCSTSSQRMSAIQCFTNILRNESCSGFYKGVTSPLITVAALHGIMFGTYGSVMKYRNDDSLKSHFVAGGAAGLAVCPLLCPMELVKTRLQMQNNSELSTISNRPRAYRYDGAIDCVRKIYKANGIAGLYRGMNGVILREVPSIAIYFPTYEYLKQLFQNMRPEATSVNTFYLFMAGGISGCVSWGISYPIDVFKARLQADGTYSSFHKAYRYKYKGLLDCYRSSVKAHGFSILFRGLSTALARAFPNSAVCLTVVMFVHTFVNTLSSSSCQSPTISTSTAADSSNLPIDGQLQ